MRFVIGYVTGFVSALVGLVVCSSVHHENKTHEDVTVLKVSENEETAKTDDTTDSDNESEKSVEN